MSTLKADSIQPTNSGNNLIFKTGVGDAERMRINTSGEVGIGTNAPSQKLHVYDGALRVDLLSGTNSAILAGPGSNLQIKHTSGNSNLTMYNSGGGGFIFSTAPTGTEGERIRITGDGSLGIGTATPGASLDVNGDIKSSTYVRATSGMVIGGATFDAPSGAAPLFGARAWARFNGTSYTLVSGEYLCSIGASGNISKIVRVGTGQYDVYFSTPMPDANYAMFATSSKQAPNYDTNVCFYIDVDTAPSVNRFRINCTAVNYNTSVMQDAQFGSVVVFR